MASRLSTASSTSATYEHTAVRLFYERAADGHRPLRAVLAVMLGVILLAFGLIGPAVAVVWVLALALGEVATKLWYERVFARASSARSSRRALRQLVAIAGVLAGVFAVPFAAVAGHGVFGSAIGLALSLSVLLVVAAQHNLTRGMFYSSAAIPGVGVLLNTLSLDGGAHGVVLGLMTFALLASARNVQHANADTFRNLVETRLAAEATNARLGVALDAAEASSRAKSVFLAMMGHELRTPLNGVIGMADALARSTPSPEAATQIEVIRRSGEDLLARLDDMLHLSLADTDEIRLVSAAFDCHDLVETAAAVFQHAATAKSLGLFVDVALRERLRMGDAARLRQILHHLVSNAIKFTDRGAVCVRVWSETYDDVVFEVSDTGPGVSEEAAATLFDRFVQGDGSSTRRQGGLGVGLSICEDLARRMQGGVTLHSRLGLGSTFTLRVPLPRAADAPATAPAPPATSTREPDRGRVRVLCAEDNAINRVVLQTLLSALDCDSSMAVNGDEALQAWRDADFDVVLMDIQMPVMDGLSAMRAIRAEEASRRLPRTPLVSVTADAMDHQVAEQRAAGADLHLAKPIDTTALSQTLSRAMEIGLEARRPLASPVDWAHTA